MGAQGAPLDYAEEAVSRELRVDLRRTADPSLTVAFGLAVGLDPLGRSMHR
jgi:hypothetical protein